jgi:hypothetical protein
MRELIRIVGTAVTFTHFEWSYHTSIMHLLCATLRLTIYPVSIKTQEKRGSEERKSIWLISHRFPDILKIITLLHISVCINPSISLLELLVALLRGLLYSCLPFNNFLDLGLDRAPILKDGEWDVLFDAVYHEIVTLLRKQKIGLLGSRKVRNAVSRIEHCRTLISR